MIVFSRIACFVFILVLLVLNIIQFGQISLLNSRLEVTEEYVIKSTENDISIRRDMEEQLDLIGRLITIVETYQDRIENE